MGKSNDSERVEYGFQSTRNTDVIGRLLNSDKDDMFQKWKQLSHQLDEMAARLEDLSRPTSEPLHYALIRLVAETRLLCQEKLQNKHTHPGNPEPVIEFIQRLAQLKEIKDLEQVPESLYDSQSLTYLYDRSIRERLQEIWTERYARSRERTILRERQNQAQTEQDQVTLQVILAEKRVLRRRVFQDCVTEQLYEIQQQHDQTVAAATKALEKTIVLYISELSLLLDGVLSPVAAVSDVVDKRANIIEMFSSTLEDIEIEIDQLDMALDIIIQRTRKMLRRIDRLSAGDVESESDRQWEQQRRLVRPQAVLYILKAAQDAEDISAKVKNAKQHTIMISHHLARIQDGAEERWWSLKMQTYLAWTMIIGSRQMVVDRNKLREHHPD